MIRVREVLTRSWTVLCFILWAYSSTASKRHNNSDLVLDLKKFFARLFNRNGIRRMTVSEALQHPWQIKGGIPSYIKDEYFQPFISQ